MPTIVPVKFKFAARRLWFDPADVAPLAGDHVICETERGQEIGICLADPQEISEEDLAKEIGDAQLKRVLRVADDADLARADELSRKGEEALPTFKRLSSNLDLEMKCVGVEYLFDGEKIVCYFTADDRIDFRQLVRDLSHELHERIDMRQIGVREEAAIVGGYGHCGQELCCTRFGLSFEPVTIRMAKEQDLPLNSSKISGACGRLMCCLRYEFEAYRDFKSRAPKRNALIQTPLGSAKIVEYDTPKEEIVLRLEDGQLFRIPLEEMSASDAACAKSAELGCSCRPDSVSRSALERLNSPEIQEALAELDAAASILPGAPTDEKSRSRKKALAERNPASAMKHIKIYDEPADEEVAGDPEEERPSRRRRHKSRTARARQEQQESRTDEQVEEAQPRRRRRHKKAEEGTSSVQPHEQAQAQAPARPRRAHHAVDSSEQTRSPRRRRRPGDRGGSTSENTASAPTAGTSAPERSAQPRRRRRHMRSDSGNNSES